MRLSGLFTAAALAALLACGHSSTPVVNTALPAKLRVTLQISSPYTHTAEASDISLEVRPDGLPVVPITGGMAFVPTNVHYQVVVAHTPDSEGFTVTLGPNCSGVLTAEDSAPECVVSVTELALDCDNAQWDHTYNKPRFVMARSGVPDLGTCLGISGTLKEVYRSSDGDLVAILTVDSEYVKYVGKRNLLSDVGGLVAEIVCTYTPDADLDLPLNSCGGYRAKPITLAPGMRVRVKGMHALDGNHDVSDPQSELHGVKVRILSLGPVTSSQVSALKFVLPPLRDDPEEREEAKSPRRH